MKRIVPALALGFVLAALAIPQFLFAADWNVDADGSWNIASNWLGPIPDGPADTAVFGPVTSANRNITITDPADNNITLNQLAFDGHYGYVLTTGTGQTLTFGGTSPTIQLSGDSGNARQNLVANINLASTLTIDNESAGSLTLGLGQGNVGQLTGSSVTFTKTGSGTVFLQSDTTNLAGLTTLSLNQGTLFDIASLAIGGSAKLVFNGGRFVADANTSSITSMNVNSAGGTIDVFGGSAISISTTNELSGVGLLRKEGLGSLSLTAAQTNFTGPLEVRSGVVDASSSSQPLAHASSFTIDGASGVFAGQLQLSSTNWANVPISVGSGGVLVAPSGAGVGFASMTRGGNLTLAPGAVVAQTTVGGNTTIQNLGTNSDLFFGIGTTQTIPAITVGAGTPWMGISGIEHTNTTLNSTGSGVITAASDFTIQHYDAELTLNNTSIVSTGAPRVVTIAAPTADSLSQGVASQVLLAGPTQSGTTSQGVFLTGTATYTGVSKFVVNPGASFLISTPGMLGTGAGQVPSLELQAGGNFTKLSLSSPAVPDTLGTGASAATIDLKGTSLLTLNKPVNSATSLGGKLQVESALPSLVKIAGSASNTSGLDSLIFDAPGASIDIGTAAVDGATTLASSSAAIDATGALNLRGGLFGSGVLTKGSTGTVTVDGSLSNFGGLGSEIRVDAGAFELNNADFASGANAPAISIGVSNRLQSAGVYSLPTDVDASTRLTSDSVGILAIHSTNSSISGVNGTAAYLGADGTQNLTVSSLAPGADNTYRLGGGINTPVLNLTAANVLSGNNNLIVGMPKSWYGSLTNSTGTVVLQNSNSYTGNTNVNAGSTLAVEAPGGIGGGATAGPVNIDGTLVVRAAGSLGSTGPINVNYGGNLEMDDTAVRNTDRLPDATPIRLTGGQITYDYTSTSSETIGQSASGVTLAEGASTILGNNNFTVALINRQLGATLDTGSITIGNAASQMANGIIPWIGGDERLAFTTSTPTGLATYSGPSSTQIEGAGPNDIVISHSTINPLTANRTISALSGSGNIDTGGHILNVGTVPINGIASGEIMEAGSSTQTIGSGTNPGFLTAGQAAFAPNSASPGELIVVTNINSGSIAASIIDNAGADGVFGTADDLPVTLTKSGEFTLNLTGANNSYTGGTYLNEGTLTATSFLPGNITIHAARLELSSATAGNYVVGGDITVSNSLSASLPILSAVYTGPTIPGNSQPQLLLHGLTITPGSMINLHGNLNFAGSIDIRGAHIIGDGVLGLPGGSSTLFSGPYLDDANTVFQSGAGSYTSGYRFASGNPTDVHATFVDNPGLSAEQNTSVNFYGTLSPSRINSTPTLFLGAATGGTLHVMPGATIDASNGWNGFNYDSKLLELQGDSSGTIEFTNGFKLMQVGGTNELSDLGANKITWDNPVTLVTNNTDNLPNFNSAVMNNLPPNVYLGSINMHTDGASWVVQSNPQTYNQKLDIAADSRIITNAPLTLTADSALGMGDNDNFTLDSAHASLVQGTQSGALEKLGQADLTIQGRLYVSNYTKMTVSEGRLVMSNRTAEGYGQMDVEVRSGATLAGGSVDGSAGLIPGTVTVKSGGTLNPGNSPYGILSVIGDHPDVNLLGDSLFHPDLGGTIAGQQYDQLHLQGKLTLGDESGLPILDTELDEAPNLNDLFFIARDDSSTAVTGLFKTDLGITLSQDDLFSLVSQQNGQTYQFEISYRGDTSTNQFEIASGNDIVLRVVGVPEPSGILLIGLGAVIFFVPNAIKRRRSPTLLNRVSLRNFLSHLPALIERWPQ